MPSFLSINNQKLKNLQLIFGGGESHVKIDSGDLHLILHAATYHKPITVNCHFTQNNDLIEAFLLTDAIRSQAMNNIGIKPIIHLNIPYFPGARQDRNCCEGEPFSARVYANLVNSQKYDLVHIWDAHSDVLPALLNNCQNIPNYRFVQKCFAHLGLTPEKSIILSPDAGSNKKIFALTDHIAQITGQKYSVVRADKSRDFETGKIKGFEVMCENLQGKDIIIIDDICSRGGTFMGLAAELKKKNAGQIFLIVTHFEGTADMKQMQKCGISGVLTANNMQGVENEMLITKGLRYL